MQESMKYITTSSYGKLISTIPNLQADRILFDRIDETITATFTKYFVNKYVGNTVDNQHRYLSMMENCFKLILSEEGKFDLFSDVKDHYNRPIGRYILNDPKHSWYYIIDIFAILDVKLEISDTKRFILKHLPWKFSKVSNDQFVPTIHYQIRVWNTPVSYYLKDMYEANMTTPYSSRVERARQLFGLPKIYDPKELKCYERIDYDIRRAIFNEVTNML